MARINQQLLRRIQKESKLRPRRVYELIAEKVSKTHLDRRLATIVLASEYKIPIAKYAKPEELAAIRGTSSQLPSSLLPINANQAGKRVVRVAESLNLDLSFVSNRDLRDILQRDIAELNIARSQDIGKTAKTCMVLCGSIVEALLLDSLMQREHDAHTIAKTLPKKVSANLEDWGLDDMVSVATNLTPPLLPDDAIMGATQLRLWRNLIHPGRELKDARNKRIKPSKARARNAIAFLQFVTEELSS